MDYQDERMDGIDAKIRVLADRMEDMEVREKAREAKPLPAPKRRKK